MNFKIVRQGFGLVMLVVCLSIGSRAAAQTPTTGWSSVDIGTSLPGGTGGGTDGFTVTAAGADIWGQSDNFRFVYRTLTGDGVIIARVDGFNAPDAWSKAGLMIRESLQGGSKHASIFRSGTQGLAFQYRSATNDWTVHSAAAGNATWLKLERQGSTLIASYSTNTVTWTTLGQTTISMGNAIFVGLALTSHSGAYASADFAGVYASDATSWQSTDIGPVSYVGAMAATGNSLYLRATGADVWGGADELRFAYRPLTGDGAIIARVAGYAATDAWTKAGVMIRESLNADSKHAFALVSGTQGLAFQRRAASGGSTTHTSGGWEQAPIWLKVERRGTTVTASYSSDGNSWTQIGTDTISMSSTVYAGLALSSHTSWAYATAEFSNVSLTGATSSPPPPGGGSSGGTTSGWTSADIGSSLLGGLTSAITDGLAVTAGGLDIWGGSDQFRFAYQQMTGDGTITALVRGFSALDPWSKAGVMIRESLSASSPHGFMLISGTQGSAFQRRKTAGGATTSTTGAMGAAPFWVRLQRTGSTITASYSWDGANWATVGSDTISMGSTVYVGFAVTGHSLLALSTAYFTNASVSAGGGTTAPPAAGNQPPQVSLTSPASGATFAAPGSIAMTATASDTDGGVAVVEFYSGSTLLGSDSSSPYSYTATNVASGTYSLTAVARDTSGNMTVSSERIVTVGSATRVSQAVFVPSTNQSSAVSQYVLSIYAVGATPGASNPAASVDLGLPATVNGEIRVDITAAVSGLPSGTYFATVTAIGPAGYAASSPSGQFTR